MSGNLEMRERGNISYGDLAMKNDRTSGIDKIFSERKKIDRAIRSAVRAARLLHKRAKNPVAEWHNGKVVWVPPDKIRLR